MAASFMLTFHDGSSLYKIRESKRSMCRAASLAEGKLTLVNEVQREWHCIYEVVSVLNQGSKLPVMGSKQQQEETEWRCLARSLAMRTAASRWGGLSFESRKDTPFQGEYAATGGGVERTCSLTCDENSSIHMRLGVLAIKDGSSRSRPVCRYSRRSRAASLTHSQWGQQHRLQVVGALIRDGSSLSRPVCSYSRRSRAVSLTHGESDTDCRR